MDYPQQLRNILYLLNSDYPEITVEIVEAYILDILGKPMRNEYQATRLREAAMILEDYTDPTVTEDI